LDNLGDLICWLSVYENFLNNKVVKKNSILIINEKWISFVKNLKIFKDVLPINANLFRSSLIYRIKILLKVRKISCNFLINPTRSRSFLTDDTFSRVIKSKESIRFENDRVNMTWYDNIISNFKKHNEIKIYDNSEHRNHNFYLNYINNNFFKLKIHRISKMNKDKFKKSNIVSIVPGASSELRLYGYENFIKIGKYIFDKYNIKIYFFGTKDEFNEIEIASKKLNFKNIINLCGKTTIDEYISNLEKSRLIISNESSAAQVALYKNIEHITIMGGGHFGRFANTEYKSNIQNIIFNKMDCFNCNWKCKFDLKKDQPYKCIHEIDLNKIFSLVDRILDK